VRLGVNKRGSRQAESLSAWACQAGRQSVRCGTASGNWVSFSSFSYTAAAARHSAQQQEQEGKGSEELVTSVPRA
jgi:hypothetical protein